MGTRPRQRPKELAAKLVQIRKALRISQSQMGQLLGSPTHPGRISEYELGLREPSLTTLFAYARVAQIHLEDLVDDEVLLPERLPSTFNYQDASRRRRMPAIQA